MKFLKTLFSSCLFLMTFSAFALSYYQRGKTRDDIFTDQALVFTGHLTGYLLTQQDTIRKHGSFDNLTENFLQFKFDNDNTNWNYFGHSLTGAEVYLYYRSQGYTQNKSFYLSFLSSLWFEIFIESYTEKPSIQDTFNTPIFGSSLGFAIEKISIPLINSQNPGLKILGRILNPFSFLIDDTNLTFIPYIKNRNNYLLTVSYYYD